MLNNQSVKERFGVRVEEYIFVTLLETDSVEGSNSGRAFGSDAGVWLLLFNANSSCGPVDTDGFKSALQSTRVLVFCKFRLVSTNEEGSFVLGVVIKRSIDNALVEIFNILQGHEDSLLVDIVFRFGQFVELFSKASYEQVSDTTFSEDIVQEVVDLLIKLLVVKFCHLINYNFS